MKSLYVRNCVALLVIVLAIGTTAFVWDQMRPQYRAVRQVRELGGQVTESEDNLLQDWKVYSVSFNDKPVGDSDLEVLATFPELRHLNLSGTSITDEGLRVIVGHTQLETLDLSKTRVTGTGLWQLSGLKCLKYLNLEDTRATALDVALFADELPNLQFKCERNGFYDRIKRIDRIDPDKRIVYLDLSNTSIGDDDLKAIAALDHLRYLDLSKTNVTKAGLLHLKHMSSLRGVNLSDTQVPTMAKLALICALPECKANMHPDYIPIELQYELQSFCNILPQIWFERDPSLPGKPITKLAVDGGPWRLSGDELCGIQAMTELRELTLRWVNIKVGDLEEIARLPLLRKLTLQSCNQHTELQLDALVSGATRKGLRELDIGNSPFLGGVGLLKRLEGLHFLKLRMCGGISQESLKELHVLKNLRHLILLGVRHFGDYWQADDEAFEFLRRALPGCNIVTNKVGDDLTLTELATDDQPTELYLGLKVDDVRLKEAIARGKLARVSQVMISSPILTPEGIKALGTSKEIWVVELRGAAVNEANLQELSVFKGLTSLTLSEATFQRGWVKSLSTLTQLKSLSLHHMVFVEDTRIPAIVKLASFAELRSAAVMQDHG